MYLLAIERIVAIVSLFFLLHLSHHQASSFTPENSPGLEADSILNLPSEEIFRYDDHPSHASLILESSRQREPTPMIEATQTEKGDNKEKTGKGSRAPRKPGYWKQYYQKRKQQKANGGKEPRKKMIKKSNLTEEEKRARKDRRNESNRKNYRLLKEKVGFGRKQRYDIHQIKKKIENHIATEEEKAKYVAFTSRRREHWARSRDKLRANRIDSNPTVDKGSN